MRGSPSQAEAFSKMEAVTGPGAASSRTVTTRCLCRRAKGLPPAMHPCPQQGQSRGARRVMHRPRLCGAVPANPRPGRGAHGRKGECGHNAARRCARRPGRFRRPVTTRPGDRHQRDADLDAPRPACRNNERDGGDASRQGRERRRRWPSSEGPRAALRAAHACGRNGMYRSASSSTQAAGSAASVSCKARDRLTSTGRRSIRYAAPRPSRRSRPTPAARAGASRCRSASHDETIRRRLTGFAGSLNGRCAAPIRLERCDRRPSAGGR